MKAEVDFVNLALSDPERFESIWVFAYGSLLWKPCMQYHRQLVGHIKGFKRRFFQGNTNLRGSLTHPGRVAILVPDKEEVTWGVAYEIRGSEHVRHALEHLYLRENANGGYHSMQTDFYPRKHAQTPSAHVETTITDHNGSDCESDVESDSEGYRTDATMDSDVPESETDDDDARKDRTLTPKPFTVLLFTATSASDQWLGEADMGVMAHQVVMASGQAGPNSEYVLKTAEYVRRHIPEDRDSHLFALERRVRELLASAAEKHDHHLYFHHHQHLELEHLKTLTLVQV